MTEPQVRAAVEDLAAAAGINGVGKITRLAGGRNSRAYRVDTNGRPLFLKIYPSRTADPRPRLRAEYAFLRLAWTAGIRAVPEPIAADEDSGIGLYGFVDGRALKAAEIHDTHIEQALNLVETLNARRSSPEAAALAPASEACFAFADHLRLIDQRLAALTSIQLTGAVERAAAAFVAERLTPLWVKIAARARRVAAAAGFADEAPLPAAERCLSPSDFGFHNALLRPSGQLVFHDFEYAGWDDPAKLVADFFHQPELPAPYRYRDAFEQRVGRCLDLPPTHAARTAALRPVFGVKWVCIALNDFLPAGERRHRFAAPESDFTERRQAQLREAHRLLDNLEHESRSDSPCPLPSEGRGPGG